MQNSLPVSTPRTVSCELLCLHFKGKENMTGKKILAKINIDRKILKSGYDFTSVS